MLSTVKINNKEADRSEAPENLASDLRGAGRLSIDAVLGITDLTESLHKSVVSIGGLLGDIKNGRARGITGLVYQNIRAITELVGKGLDISLKHISQMIGETESSEVREAILAALNGIVGDHLEASENPLAIPMQIRLNGHCVDVEVISNAIQKSSGRMTLFVHGLCMNDRQWKRREHSHAEQLTLESGIPSFHLNYNSGRHISDNGRQLASLLENLFGQTNSIKELSIIAHSMGGLVSRSACHYGEQEGHQWLASLQKMIFLGTPHHGAPLEKGGNWIDLMLGLTPWSAPFAKLGMVRSSGVTDLRFGNVIEEHWRGQDRFYYTGDQRRPVPLPSGVECYAIATTAASSSGKLNNDLIGDGLVTLNSALGVHSRSEMNPGIPEQHCWVGRGINHMDLISSKEVYDVIKTWMV